MADVRAVEHNFYSRYDWCLNPPLRFQELRSRFREELDGYETLSGWQREESKANLYLFACAIACTADDYFALRWLNLKPLGARVPTLKPAVSALQLIADGLELAIKVRDIAAWQWRRRWDQCLQQVCQLVIAATDSEAESFQRLRHTASEVDATQLPPSLLNRRMRLPEAFRSQDMAHHDVLTLVDRFRDSQVSKNSGIDIMGLRTAGAYFAPLMVEYLKQHGFTDVSWFSIRPKNGITRWESRQLERVAREKKQLLIVDDYPNTGHTFRLTLELVKSCGIRPEQIAVLAPTHPAQTRWAELSGIQEPIRVFTFPTTELYKVKSLSAGDIARLYAEYCGSECNARVIEDPAVEAINDELALHSQDGHHVREKKVVAVQVTGSDGKAAVHKLFFKSAGWGWLGYHAYLTGARLSEFVPKVIGLRNGLLLSEWIDRERQLSVVVNDTLVEHIGRYVAARSRRLALTGDCRFETRTYRWTGCDDIVNILRRAYGPYVNRLKVPALRSQLQRVVTAVPTFIDGQMRGHEWLQTADRLYKADFEHHNFGGGEPDIVDPAYDLAAAIHEFRLSKSAERDLLRSYISESDDSTVGDRLLLYKILYGTMAMKRATNGIMAGRDPENNNERRQYARNFLVYSMSEFCAQFVRGTAEREWSSRLFFMDLDGVFDHELLGFPHATHCGLQSIALLRSHGFSVVPNTGRSVQHLRRYCEAYGFPGGVAEYGSVFVDTVNGREVSFVDKDAAEQLTRCRDAIRRMPGVFMDPGHVYSIRAYRYNSNGLVGLRDDEIKKLLGSIEFSKLTYLPCAADTHIVQKRISKGSAVRAVRRLVGSPDVPVAAIGDSIYDIAMLAAADFAYAPSNCSPTVRELAKQGKCKVLKQGFQNGLLAAVQERLREEHLPASIPEFDETQQQGIMETLLRAADRGPVLQGVRALIWWSV